MLKAPGDGSEEILDADGKKVSFVEGVEGDEEPEESLLPEEQVWDKPENFPKKILTPLEDNEKEIEIIKTIPYEYFKIRVKHFEQYKPSSYDEVLVNRQREIEQRDAIQEERLFFITQLPLHYWKRQDPEELMDEEQLKEKRELDALDLNKTLSKSQDINTIGSALDFQTEKSIE